MLLALFSSVAALRFADMDGLISPDLLKQAQEHGIPPEKARAEIISMANAFEKHLQEVLLEMDPSGMEVSTEASAEFMSMDGPSAESPIAWNWDSDDRRRNELEDFLPLYQLLREATHDRLASASATREKIARAAPTCPGVKDVDAGSLSKACGAGCWATDVLCQGGLGLAPGGGFIAAATCPELAHKCDKWCTGSLRKQLKKDTKIIVCDEGVLSEYECKKGKKYKHGVVKKIKKNWGSSTKHKIELCPRVAPSPGVSGCQDETIKMSMPYIKDGKWERKEGRLWFCKGNGPGRDYPLGRRLGDDEDEDVMNQEWIELGGLVEVVE